MSSGLNRLSTCGLDGWGGSCDFTHDFTVSDEHTALSNKSMFGYPTYLAARRWEFSFRNHKILLFLFSESLGGDADCAHVQVPIHIVMYTTNVYSNDDFYMHFYDKCEI